MESFVLGFVVFILVSLGLGISLIVDARPLHASCRRLPIDADGGREVGCKICGRAGDGEDG